jgi:hypothetical protein
MVRQQDVLGPVSRSGARATSTQQNNVFPMFLIEKLLLSRC